MKTLLYNIETQEAGEMRNGPYLVDGQPGPLPDYLVELTVVTHDYPELTETQTADPGISVDLENRIYNEIWNVRELTPFELAELNPVPEEVAVWRILSILKLSGQEVTVTAFIDSLEEPTKTVATFAVNNGTTFRRDSPTIALFADFAGKTGEEIDLIFRQAAALPV